MWKLLFYYYISEYRQPKMYAADFDICIQRILNEYLITTKPTATL